MEILGKLFGTPARVKILRLFLFNPQASFDNAEVAHRAKVYSSTARREIALLWRVGLIKKRTLYRDAIKKNGSRYRTKKTRVAGWTLDDKFQYLMVLQQFLLDTSPLRGNEILKRLEKVGRLKVVIIAGIFIQDFDSRVDMLIVGDGIKRAVLETAIKRIESELGRELRYAVFNTSDFEYRLNVYDKLVRDILDYPHEQVMNRLNRRLN